MKKILLSAVAALGLIGCGPVSSDEMPGTEFDLPQDAPVAVSGSIDTLPYVIPSCAGAGTKYFTERGLRRWFIPKGIDGSGRKQWIYVKSANGADYESMTADGSWIRLWKDTSWAYMNPNNPGEYCDEQCGSAGVATDCRHQWRNDPTPQGYAYQAPKDTGDWGGAKIMPRYIESSVVTTINVGLYIDAQSENTCGNCASWHEGSGGQTYTVQYLASYTNPATGFVYNNVLKKVITGGIGANEVYYYAYGRGWVGYEVKGTTYRDWVNGTGADVGNPYTCANGSVIAC